MQRSGSIATVVLAGLLAPAATARAQADEDTSDELAELSLEELLAVEIVTASNMKESLSRAPGVVIRLSRADLEARGYHELLDLFDDLPGMDVVRPWGDNYLKVYWRGYRTDTTHPFLILLDGMAVNSLWTGDASVAAAIPVTEVDHVEIVYGPASAVYGANAFMGVVNVITTAAAGEESQPLRLRVTGGSYGFDRLDRRTIDGQVVHERDGLRLSVAGRIALGYADRGAFERAEYTSDRYASDEALWGDYLGYENLARGTSSPIDQYGLDVRLSGGGFELGATALRLDTGYGLVYPTDRVQPFAHWIQDERSVHVSYRGELSEQVTSRTLVRGRDSGIANASYFLSGYETGMPEERVLEVSYWQARNRSIALSEDVEVTVSDAITLTAGTRYERKDLQGAYDVTIGTLDRPGEPIGELPVPPSDDLRALERPITDDYGIFAQARLRKAGVLCRCDAHALHLGIRYDRNSVFGDGHSPTLRVGYVGELDGKHGLFLGKLLYGEGFHEPNPRQLYGGWLGSGSSPELRPETSRTIELNLSHTNDRLSNLVSAYYVHNADTIVQFAGGAANAGERDVVGVDYHLRALLRPPGVDSLSLWGYYSYIWSEELIFDDAGDEIRQPIGDLAAHKVWIGATAERGKLTGTLRGRGAATRDTVATNPQDEIKGAFVLDATARLERVGGHPLSLALQVDNVLGTHYSHPGIRTADAGRDPGSWNGPAWDGSDGWYNSRLPQPGRRVLVTLGLDL
jgi:outer membrane receptor for ferrienterochelin and colicins